jgi:hypothetical protein
VHGEPGADAAGDLVDRGAAGLEVQDHLAFTSAG